MINVERWMRNENRFNRYMVECEYIHASLLTIGVCAF